MAPRFLALALLCNVLHDKTAAAHTHSSSGGSARRGFHGHAYSSKRRTLNTTPGHIHASSHCMCLMGQRMLSDHIFSTMPCFQDHPPYLDAAFPTHLLPTPLEKSYCRPLPAGVCLHTTFPSLTCPAPRHPHHPQATIIRAHIGINHCKILMSPQEGALANIWMPLAECQPNHLRLHIPPATHQAHKRAAAHAAHSPSSSPLCYKHRQYHHQK
jgi:hypothetical protein